MKIMHRLSVLLVCTSSMIMPMDSAEKPCCQALIQLLQKWNNVFSPDESETLNNTIQLLGAHNQQHACQKKTEGEAYFAHEKDKMPTWMLQKINELNLEHVTSEIYFVDETHTLYVFNPDSKKITPHNAN